MNATPAASQSTPAHIRRRAQMWADIRPQSSTCGPNRPTSVHNSESREMWTHIRPADVHIHRCGPMWTDVGPNPSTCGPTSAHIPELRTMWTRCGSSGRPGPTRGRR